MGTRIGIVGAGAIGCVVPARLRRAGPRVADRRAAAGLTFGQSGAGGVSADRQTVPAPGASPGGGRGPHQARPPRPVGDQDVRTGTK